MIEAAESTCNNIAEVADDICGKISGFCTDAYNKISHHYLLQQKLQMQIMVKQLALVANTAEYIGEAIVQECNDKEAQSRQNVAMIQSCFATPERAKTTAKVIGAEFVCIGACISGEPFAIIGSFVLFAVEFVDAVD